MTPHLESVLDTGAALLYLVASAGYGAHLLLRQPALARVGRIAAWGAVALQTGAIGVHCAATGRTPFTTPAETLMASAWAVALLYLVLERVMHPKPLALGAFALPAAFLCLFGGSVLGLIHAPGTASLGPAHELNSRIVSLHVVALLFAFGLLTLAFGTAVLYLLQHSLLKRRGPKNNLWGKNLWGKLPPLASLEHTAFALVAFAFPLLTVGLLAGVIRAAAGGLPAGWATDPKTLASGVTWAVYGGYLLLHRTAAGRGPRASYLLLGGLLAALATYLVPTGAHRFG